MTPCCEECEVGLSIEEYKYWILNDSKNPPRCEECRNKQSIFFSNLVSEMRN